MILNIFYFLSLSNLRPNLPSYLVSINKIAFLCPLSANDYGIEFLAFSIRDYTSKKMLFEVSKASMATSGKFINCEDGLEIPW